MGPPGPTDVGNKEHLLNWDLCHQSGFRIIFNSRLGALAVGGGVIRRGSDSEEKLAGAGNEVVLCYLKYISSLELF